MDGLTFVISISFATCFIIGFTGYWFEVQNQKMLEETQRLIEKTNDLSMTYINDYYKSNKLKMDEIEKTLLAEMACLAAKNNNDIKEIKEKITTGKKSKRISQLIDENNKLKEENKKLKEENTKLKEKIKEKNSTCFYVPYSYNPYTSVINNMCSLSANQNKYRW